ncbi:hypothetical protein Y032_0014g2428 [Ancylostoma ceylanicum]|uniref:Uncharacterized protein n=1 Tax=Ancylostoma ceylanicum TaxID=53326 RepID=A0A016V9E6_9BILA|nr:hypothetical protein Y032_0014g2428 [Ancylostoma ceylanicum]
MAGQGQTAAVISAASRDATALIDRILDNLQSLIAANRRERMRTLSAASTQRSLLSRSLSTPSEMPNTSVYNVQTPYYGTAEERTSMYPTANSTSYLTNDSMTSSAPSELRTARQNSAFSDTSAGSTASTGISPSRELRHTPSELPTAKSRTSRRGRSPTLRRTTNSQSSTITPREAWSQVPVGRYSVIRPMDDQPRSNISASTGLSPFSPGSSISRSSTPFSTTESTLSLMNFNTARAISERRGFAGFPHRVNALDDADVKTARLPEDAGLHSESLVFSIYLDSDSWFTGPAQKGNRLDDADVRTARLPEDAGLQPQSGFAQKGSRLDDADLRTARLPEDASLQPQSGLAQKGSRFDDADLRTARLPEDAKDASLQPQSGLAQKGSRLDDADLRTARLPEDASLQPQSGLAQKGSRFDDADLRTARLPEDASLQPQPGFAQKGSRLEDADLKTARLPEDAGLLRKASRLEDADLRTARLPEDAAEQRVRSRLVFSDMNTTVVMETDGGRTGSPHYVRLLDDDNARAAIFLQNAGPSEDINARAAQLPHITADQCASRSSSADLITAVALETGGGRTGSPHYARLLDDTDTRTARLPEDAGLLHKVSRLEDADLRTARLPEDAGLLRKASRLEDADLRTARLPEDAAEQRVRSRLLFSDMNTTVVMETDGGRTGSPHYVRLLDDDNARAAIFLQNAGPSEDINARAAQLPHITADQCASRSSSADLITAVALETGGGRTGSPHYARLLDDTDTRTAVLPQDAGLLHKVSRLEDADLKTAVSHTASLGTVATAILGAPGERAISALPGDIDIKTAVLPEPAILEKVTTSILSEAPREQTVAVAQQEHQELQGSTPENPSTDVSTARSTITTVTSDESGSTTTEGSTARAYSRPDPSQDDLRTAVPGRSPCGRGYSLYPLGPSSIPTDQMMVFDSHAATEAALVPGDQNIETGPAVTREQSEQRLRTASPIGSPCGRTKFQVPLGPSAIPTDQIVILNTEATTADNKDVGASTGPAVTGQQNEYHMRTASPIGSPCGRTKFQVPLGPSAIPTDRILILKAEATEGPSMNVAESTTLSTPAVPEDTATIGGASAYTSRPVIKEQSEDRLMTAAPIGSPCGRTKLHLPLGPSAIPTDQILMMGHRRAHSPRSQRSAVANPSDFFSPTSASGRRPLTSLEREHWTFARNANSDPNASSRMKTARESSEQRPEKPKEQEKGRSASPLSPIASTAKLPSGSSLFKESGLERPQPKRTAEEQKAIDEMLQKPRTVSVSVPEAGVTQDGLPHVTVIKLWPPVEGGLQQQQFPTAGPAAHTLQAPAQNAAQNFSEMHTAILGGSMSPSHDVATAREWMMSPTPGVVTALEETTSPTKGVQTAKEVPMSPTPNVNTAKEIPPFQPEVLHTARAPEVIKPAESPGLSTAREALGPDVLDTSRLRGISGVSGGPGPDHTPFSTRVPSIRGSSVPPSGGSARSDASSSQGYNPRVHQRGLFARHPRLLRPIRISPIRPRSSMSGPDRRDRIALMRARQSQPSSRSMSSQTADSQRGRDLSFRSSLRSYPSGSSSTGMPSIGGVRLGRSGRLEDGSSRSRLLRGRSPSFRSVRSIPPAHWRRATTPSDRPRNLGTAGPAANIPTDSTTPEPASTTANSSTTTTRPGLTSTLGETPTGPTTSGSRFGRRIRPGDGYASTGPGSSSRSGLGSGEMLGRRLPSSRFGLPPAPEGWSERVRLRMSQDAGGAEGHQHNHQPLATARTSSARSIPVAAPKKMSLEKMSLIKDSSTKTARPPRRSLRRPKPQDTRPSYYGPLGKPKRINKRNIRKPRSQSTSRLVQQVEVEEVGN